MDYASLSASEISLVYKDRAGDYYINKYLIVDGVTSLKAKPDSDSPSKWVIGRICCKIIN